MNIDVVVSNPPYNNDIYIPFVELGHRLATICSVFITPAKWQAKGDNAKDKPNERFRQNIAPYMSKIVYYKDSTDVFDIEEWGGISYYVVNKNISATHELKCVCNSNNSLNNDYETHDEKDIVLYGRDLLTIIGKVGQLGEGFKQSLYVKNTDHGEKIIDSQLGEGFKQSLYVKNTDHGEKSIDSQLGFKRCIFVGEQDRGQQEIPPDYVEVMQGEKVCGYKKKSELFTQLNIDKWKCICSIMPGAVSKFDNTGKVLGMFKISIIKPNQVPKGSFPVLKYFDTEDECKSFISYMECRLTAFLYYLGCCGTTLTKEFFRFIPDPMKFDHIFTDEELYKKYNLTQEEINIIESVIKERK